jgi:hypothetical protein
MTGYMCSPERESNTAANRSRSAIERNVLLLHLWGQEQVTWRRLGRSDTIVESGSALRAARKVAYSPIGRVCRARFDLM